MRRSRAVTFALTVAAAVALAACASREDRFRKAAMSEIARAHPDVRVVVKEPLLLELTFPGDGGSASVFLGHAFQDCHGEFAGCDSAARLLRTLPEALPHEMHDGGDPAALRPVLKDARWIADADEQMKNAPADKQAGNRLVRAPFVADLSIVYVFDMPDGMRMVSERDRAALGLTPAALDARARANLAAALPLPLPSEEVEDGIHQVHTGDSYEASRLLLADRWDAPARTVKGDLLAAVPSRDVVVYTGAGEKPEIRARFRALVHEYATTLGHPISETILRRTRAGWQRAADGP